MQRSVEYLLQLGGIQVSEVEDGGCFHRTFNML